MTAKDMVGACFVQTECVGGSLDNKIRCHIRNISTPDWKDKARTLTCHYRAKQYTDREEQLDKIGNDLVMEHNRLVKDISNVTKKEDIKKLKEHIADHGRRVDRFIGDVRTYDKELRELTDEYFNTIEVI